MLRCCHSDGPAAGKVAKVSEHFMNQQSFTKGSDYVLNSIKLFPIYDYLTPRFKLCNVGNKISDITQFKIEDFIVGNFDSLEMRKLLKIGLLLTNRRTTATTTTTTTTTTTNNYYS